MPSWCVLLECGLVWSLQGAQGCYAHWQNTYRGEGTEFQTPKYVKGRCGPDFNDQICQPGAFCSGSGWCGNSSEHMKITHDWNQYHGKGALGLWSQCDRSILWESTLGDTCEHPDVQVDWRDKSGRPAGNYCGRFCAPDLVGKALLEPTDWIHEPNSRSDQSYGCRINREEWSDTCDRREIETRCKADPRCVGYYSTGVCFVATDKDPNRGSNKCDETRADTGRYEHFFRRPASPTSSCYGAKRLLDPPEDDDTCCTCEDVKNAHSRVFLDDLDWSSMWQCMSPNNNACGGGPAKPAPRGLDQLQQPAVTAPSTGFDGMLGPPAVATARGTWERVLLIGSEKKPTGVSWGCKLDNDWSHVAVDKRDTLENACKGDPYCRGYYDNGLTLVASHKEPKECPEGDVAGQFPYAIFVKKPGSGFDGIEAARAAEAAVRGAPPLLMAPQLQGPQVIKQVDLLGGLKAA